MQRERKGISQEEELDDEEKKIFGNDLSEVY